MWKLAAKLHMWHSSQWNQEPVRCQDYTQSKIFDRVHRYKSVLQNVAFRCTWSKCMQNNKEARSYLSSAPETSHVTASCGMFFSCKTAWICLQPFIYFLTMKCQLLCPMLHRHYKIFSLIYRTFSLRWCHGITCSDLMTFFYLNSCDNSNVTFFSVHWVCKSRRNRLIFRLNLDYELLQSKLLYPVEVVVHLF